MLTSRRNALGILCALSLAAAVLTAGMPPVAQDRQYHRLADDRTVLGVPRAMDVFSNLPFLLFGLQGLLWTLSPRGRAAFLDLRELPAYALFFGGVALTGIGSAYYHLAPDDARLVWDRLPMTLGFMSVTAAMISERIGVEAGRRWLGPLLLAGVGSVVWWRMFDDLRPYALVQFLPLLLIPLMVALLPPRYTHSHDIFLVLGWYVLAKVFELFDRPIYEALGIVSGHSLKHLAAAAACGWAWWMLMRRRPAGSRVSPGPAIPRG